MPSRFRIPSDGPFSLLVGVGGIGAGMVFALEGNQTLGRNESRPGRLLDVRDYCKLHIISHYVSVLVRADPSGERFRVLPVGKVGEDPNGHGLLREMSESGQDTRFVETVPSRPTLLSVCFQYPDASGGNITTSDSAAALLSVSDVERVRSILEAAGRRGIVLAVPEVPLGIRRHLIELGTETGALRLASFTPTEIEEAVRTRLLDRVDLLAINEDEGKALTSSAFEASSPNEFLDALAQRLRQHNPAMRIILTAGSSGAYAFDTRWTFLPAHPVTVVNTGGAGDALFGGTVAGLIAGLPLPRAVELGALLAGYSVTSPHTIHPQADLDHLLAFAEEEGISLHEEILNCIETEKSQ